MKAEEASRDPERVEETAPVEEPKPRRPRVRRIDIFRAWCKGCGICVAFCPRGVLAIDEDGYPFVKDLEACTACGWCEIRCPDFAITVESRRRRSRSGESNEKE
jgi:2-oxoglutarate ferredoxin oxidoreductase subunit delta